jgi:hypothetical protein
MLILAPVVALIVEGLKTLAQDVAKYDVKPLAARIAAYVISLALSLAASLHLPFGISALLPRYLQAAQPVLVALILAAASYASHDIGLAIQRLIALVSAWAGKKAA